MLEELSLHLLDIGMNAIAAGARTVAISVRESPRRNRLALRVRDDGRGMDAAGVTRALARRASTKTGRHKGIGLGLALLRQTAEMCGGTFRLRSVPGRGTVVGVSLPYGHIDRPPLGDLTATILALCAADPRTEVRLRYRSDEHQCCFSSHERAQQPEGPTHHEPGRTETIEGKSAAASRAA